MDEKERIILNQHKCRLLLPFTSYGTARLLWSALTRLISSALLGRHRLTDNMGISAVDQSLPLSMLNACRCKWTHHQTHMIHTNWCGSEQSSCVWGRGPKRRALSIMWPKGGRNQMSTIIVLFQFEVCKLPSLFPGSVLAPPILESMHQM